MSKEDKDMIVIGKKKFAILIAVIVGGTIIANGIVTQALERLF
ncbi:hypothetical protein [Jeotgalibacillus terrae]|uniref:Uncharacterized protein n=1 Tax=Jeotgalibacillus terrae TaxID=587735 RepID=A0ABW5ZDV9_9BACL|nr:hypothetical protein [Jeotgalibacillus terrae]MBM7579117.1 hypothetical protein [Jeotgalibacillus terrae]